MSDKTIEVGIDPDLHKSGVATAKDGVLITLDAMTLFELVAFIDEHKHQALFKLEDVNAIKPTFPRSVKCARTGRMKPVNQAVRDNISQKVGMVKAAGLMIQRALEEAGADFVLVKPLQGFVKRAKDDAAFFNKLTGWVGKSNQDKRDAALIALYGGQRGRIGKTV